MSSPDSLLELIRREIRRELAHTGGALVMAGGGDGGDQAAGNGNGNGGDFGGGGSGDGGGDFGGGGSSSGDGGDVGAGGGDGGGDSMTPTYLKIDPGGTISADFTGHVHGAGFDLDAATLLVPPDTDRIRWLLAGVQIAELLCWSVAGNGNVLELLARVTAGQFAEAMLGAAAAGSTGTPEAALEVTYDAGAGTAAVFAIAFGQQKLVISGTGKSDYLQLGPLNPGARSAVGVDSVHFPGGSQFSNLKNIPLAGAAGTVQMLANAYNIIGTGVVILCGPDGVGGSNVQAWSSIAPAASDVTFQYLQWGN